MASPAAPLLAAIEAVLLGSAALAAALGGKNIYVEVPAGAKLPYVVFGELQVFPDEDDDCGTQAEAFATVHVWSRRSALDSGAQAAGAAAAVIEALNAQLTVPGWSVDLWQTQGQQLFTDPDQSTHVVLTFRYLLVEQSA